MEETIIMNYEINTAMNMVAPSNDFPTYTESITQFQDQKTMNSS